MKIIAKTEYSVTEYCNLGTNPEIRIDLQLFSIYEWIETKKPDFPENWDAFNGCIPLSRTHCIVITRSIIISNKCVCFFPGSKSKVTRIQISSLSCQQRKQTSLDISSVKIRHVMAVENFGSYFWYTLCLLRHLSVPFEILALSVFNEQRVKLLSNKFNS